MRLVSITPLEIIGQTRQMLLSVLRLVKVKMHYQYFICGHQSDPQKPQPAGQVENEGGGGACPPASHSFSHSKSVLLLILMCSSFYCTIMAIIIKTFVPAHVEYPYFL